MAKTALICADSHHTYEGAQEGGVDPRAWSCLLQAIPIVKPDTFIHLGDMLEMNSVSPWQWKRRRRPPLEYTLPTVEAELAVGNAVLDDLDKRLDKVKCADRRFCNGNHEKWQDYFIEEHPYLEEKYGLKNALGFDRRGWKFHDYGEYARLGSHLALTHGGHYGGQNHTRATALGLGVCCIYGHYHSHQITKVQRLDGLIGAWSLPCLCKLDKKFLRGKPSDWSHGFAIVHLDEDTGEFHVEVIEVFNGKCWVYGKRVEAKL